MSMTSPSITREGFEGAARMVVVETRDTAIARNIDRSINWPNGQLFPRMLGHPFAS